MKKYLVGLGVALCLLVAGSKIYKFYLSTQPPFAVGECFAVQDANLGEVKFEVIKNDSETKETYAVASVNNAFGLEGFTIKIPVKGSYQELRDSGLKKVSCE